MNNTEFSAHAFHDQFKNGRASGTLTISDAHIHFHNDQDQVRFPIAQAHFKLGGASDRLIFISHPSYPDWNLYTSDMGLLNHSALQNDDAIQQQIRHIKTKKRRAWGIFGSIAALFIAVPLFIVLSMDSITGSLAKHIPTEWETSLGETAFAQYQIGQTFLDQEDTDRLLNPLIQPLLDQLQDSPYEFKFHISNDTAVNAFALPGGYIVINSGLILESESAEELLGVVAHELSHITQQHSLRNVMGTAGVYLTVNAALGDMSGILALLVDAAPFLINQSYSRGFESEADEKGLQLLTQANIDPQGLLTFFETMLEQEQKQLEELAGKEQKETVQSTLQFLSTHPATQDRIDHLSQLIEALPHQRTLDLNESFMPLKERVKHFIAKDDEDTQ